ncbi:copper amine oxidase N-terminal domain-containing protein [Paenibacillus macquariensis]|uniref:Copper amine oxidase N-terminal domain-containing protein n=1 Tax=Paenibacillus macquariensis TaxID=948756 RepID=A0ABY1KB08_9BACL|nr:copper amine oxidase N-terminal domain-containing protein [Paenibacillus macquariensis]MEC0089511.1 copper amine oxidase N-terminal domain-containing protein [Paenibacillus macquariensis]OAB25817.1 hypothetical protein PMSM_28010 [Paenibacillus macquariensis subsp. macquariensis]SIR53040.1 Copper amine oxidase N-terminal domain-containing protein [Paenibacillus macquariensis]
MKIKVFTLLFMVSVLFTWSLTAMANSTIEIVFNGTDVTSEFSTNLVGNTVFVPIESLNSRLKFGFLVGSTPNLIILESNEYTIYLTIGSTTMKKNDEILKLKSPPFAKDGVTWVPLRAVAEGFDSKVVWDQHTNLVSVITKGKVEK